jgi:hypothetical protein
MPREERVRFAAIAGDALTEFGFVSEAAHAPSEPCKEGESRRRCTALLVGGR